MKHFAAIMLLLFSSGISLSAANVNPRSEVRSNYQYSPPPGYNPPKNPGRGAAPEYRNNSPQHRNRRPDKRSGTPEHRHHPRKPTTVQLQITIPETDAQPAWNALLPVEITISNPPEYLMTDFNVLMENTLLQKGIRLHNFNAVKKVLSDSNLPRLNEMTPALFMQIGKVLQVKNIIVCAITRFEVVQKPFHVRETGAKGFNTTGFQEGYVRVISVATGELISTIPFRQELDFRTLSKELTRNWVLDDYYRHMTQNTVNALGEHLSKIPALKELPAL